MVKDAEAHAEDDKKFNELIAARNQADQMIHAIEKSLKDLGEKVEADEKKAIEDAIAAAREAVKGDDKDARSEEHTSELQSLMRNSYAVFCLKKKKKKKKHKKYERTTTNIQKTIKNVKKRKITRVDLKAQDKKTHKQIDPTNSII